MSKPAAKISPTGQMGREIRKKNKDGIIKEIENDFKTEKNADRKNTIAACLAEAKKTRTYISGDDTFSQNLDWLSRITHSKCFEIKARDVAQETDLLLLVLESVRLLVYSLPRI